MKKWFERDIKMVLDKIVRADNNDAWVEVRAKKIAPPEVSAQVLKKMKKTTEDYLGEPVTEAVITVHSLFQRLPAPGHQGCRPYGAGSKRIINEPTAAAWPLAWKKEGNRKVAVYDLRAGAL